MDRKRYRDMGNGNENVCPENKSALYTGKSPRNKLACRKKVYGMTSKSVSEK